MSVREVGLDGLPGDGIILHPDEAIAIACVAASKRLVLRVLDLIAVVDGRVVITSGRESSGRAI